MGFFSRLFGGKKKSTKKYEEIYLQARKMNQSVEYAFRQAVENAVRDGVYSSRDEAVEALWEILEPQVDPDDREDFNRAKEKAAHW